MRRAVIATVIAAATVAVAGCGTVDTGTSDRTDWPEAPERPWEAMATPEAPTVDGWDDEERTDAGAGSTGTGLFDLGYQFYVRGITQIDGARCEHRPTCSRYAYEAVVKHGFVVGTMLAVDRLMRSDRSSVLRRLPTHSIQDRTMFYDDPLERNDFFL